MEFTNENINVLKAIIDNLDPKLLKVLDMTRSSSNGDDNKRGYTKELQDQLNVTLELNKKLLEINQK